jgi:hypothetical protein
VHEVYRFLSMNVSAQLSSSPDWRQLVSSFHELPEDQTGCLSGADQSDASGQFPPAPSPPAPVLLKPPATGADAAPPRPTSCLAALALVPGCVSVLAIGIGAITGSWLVPPAWPPCSISLRSLA